MLKSIFAKHMEIRKCGMIANESTFHQSLYAVDVITTCHRTTFNNENKPYRIVRLFIKYDHINPLLTI